MYWYLREFIDLHSIDLPSIRTAIALFVHSRHRTFEFKSWLELLNSLLLTLQYQFANEAKLLKKFSEQGLSISIDFQ